MNKFLLQLVIICLLGIIIYRLYIYKQSYSNASIEKYQKTIDSLTIEINKKDEVIGSLDSTRSVLDSLLILDKAKLADVAKKAQQYKNQYEKELNRFNNMSDDDIISTFTTTFK
jgi:SMC interacting uncharacterized protein involved in chromosome segregation